MSNRTQNHIITTDKEQLSDLTVKYDALEQEFNVLNLTVAEYKKEINELKEKNIQLMEENKNHTESQQFQRYRNHLTHELSVTLDDLDLDNTDLNMQLLNSNQNNKQMQSEISALKAENEQFKKALEDSNAMKQKREEMYLSNKLKLVNKINDLNNDIVAMKELLSNAYTIRVDQDIDENQTLLSPSAPRQESNDIMKVIYKMSNRNSNRNSTRSIYLDKLSPRANIENTPEFVHYYGNDSIRSVERIGSGGELLDVPCVDKQGSLENSEFIAIPKEELYKLKNSNHEYEERIGALNEEVLRLKEKNRELTQKSKEEKRFSCLVFDWFS